MSNNVLPLTDLIRHGIITQWGAHPLPRQRGAEEDVHEVFVVQLQLLPRGCLHLPHQLRAPPEVRFHGEHRDILRVCGAR